MPVLDLGASVSSSSSRGSPTTASAELPADGVLEAVVVRVPSISADLGVGLKKQSGQRLIPHNGRYFTNQGLDREIAIPDAPALKEGEQLVGEYFTASGSDQRVVLLALIGGLEERPAR